MLRTSAYEEFIKRLEEIRRDPVRRKETEATLALVDWFAHMVLNSLSAHIAILDARGVIIQTNRAWREFALANDLKMRPSTIGVNYLDLCDSARGRSAKGSREVAKGIREVIAGKVDEFVVDYSLHTGAEKRWYYMRATRLSGPDPIRVVVSHENITALKLAEEALRKREKELELQTQSLEEANTALKVLLRRREEDRKELEEKVLANTTELVGTYIAKLNNTMLNPRQKQYVEIIESSLNDIVSPFRHRLTSRYSGLTPKEIHVARLIRDGKTTKEMAQILEASASAIDFHRKNIRKKLDLTGKNTNLQSYLSSLSW
jgi:DNA-binding CsgD family transcriptional regulator